MLTFEGKILMKICGNMKDSLPQFKIGKNFYQTGKEQKRNVQQLFE